MTAQNPALPVLRQDLEFFSGPSEADGSPTCTVYDPVSGQYTKLGWAETQVLQRLRPGLRLNDLLQEINAYTTLRVAAEDVLALCRMAMQKKLTATRAAPPETPASTRGIIGWLIDHYLYFRIPLIRPDALLARAQPYVRPLGSLTALVLYALVVGAGLFMLAGRFDEYVTTFPYFFNLPGAIAFALALTAFKIIHEFSHAFAARAFGARVRTMGIAVIVFWPVPFCDVTDAWRLRERTQRFLIGFAGVGAELIIAGIGLFLWGILPDGIPRSLCFVASSTALLSTLLVNANPAMRYDGYYLLADAWGIDNLRERASSVTRWWIYTRLLGLELSCPEENLSGHDLVGMIVFSLYSWVYRFFLYIGIAVLVYHKFVKAVGILLFAAEIGGFILRPMIREIRNMLTMRRHFRWNARAVITAALLLGLGLWLVLPLPRSVSAPALTQPARRQVLYVPQAGLLRNLSIRRGDAVTPGTPLFEVTTPALTTQLDILQKEAEILKTQIRILRSQDEQEGLLPKKIEEAGKVEAEMNRLNELAGQSRFVAAIDGVVILPEDSLREGMAVGQNAVLGEVVSADAVRITAFLEETRLYDLRQNMEVMFVCPALRTRVPGRVESITPVSGTLNEYAALTSAGGGDLAVQQTARGDLEPVQSLYRIEIALTDSQHALPLGQSGFIRFRSPPRSLALDALRYAWTVILRESGM